jgi:hypothetical protein
LKVLIRNKPALYGVERKGIDLDAANSELADLEQVIK